MPVNEDKKLVLFAGKHERSFTAMLRAAGRGTSEQTGNDRKASKVRREAASSDSRALGPADHDRAIETASHRALESSGVGACSV